MGGMIRDLLRPVMMFAEDGGANAGGAAVPGGTTVDDPPATNGATTGDEGGSAEPVTFTPAQQAKIDQLIAKAHGKAKTQAEKELKDWLDQQNLTAEQQAQAQAQQATQLAEDAKRDLLAGRVEVAAERAALKAGVRPERIDRFLKLADLTDLDNLTSDGKADPDAIAQVIEQTLADVPEFKGTTAPVTATGGDMSQGTTSKKTWTRAELAKLTPAEFAEHEAEIEAQIRAGKVT